MEGSSHGLRKVTKNLCQGSWSSGQNLNLVSVEYEASVLTTQPQHSVHFSVIRKMVGGKKAQIIFEIHMSVPK
jgi:hypothetical protein